MSTELSCEAGCSARRSTASRPRRCRFAILITPAPVVVQVSSLMVWLLIAIGSVGALAPGVRGVHHAPNGEDDAEYRCAARDVVMLALRERSERPPGNLSRRFAVTIGRSRLSRRSSRRCRQAVLLAAVVDDGCSIDRPQQGSRRRRQTDRSGVLCLAEASGRSRLRCGAVVRVLRERTLGPLMPHIKT